MPEARKFCFRHSQFVLRLRDVPILAYDCFLSRPITFVFLSQKVRCGMRDFRVARQPISSGLSRLLTVIVAPQFDCHPEQAFFAQREPALSDVEGDLRRATRCVPSFATRAFALLTYQPGTTQLLSSSRLPLLCATLFLTLFPRFARDAVVPRWIRFISAFPARRLVAALNQKLNVSGVKASLEVYRRVYPQAPPERNNPA
jgi:hypothetical protein